MDREQCTGWFTWRQQYSTVRGLVNCAVKARCQQRIAVRLLVERVRARFKLQHNEQEKIILYSSRRRWPRPQNYAYKKQYYPHQSVDYSTMPSNALVCLCGLNLWALVRLLPYLWCFLLVFVSGSCTCLGILSRSIFRSPSSLIEGHPHICTRSRPNNARSKNAARKSPKSDRIKLYFSSDRKIQIEKCRFPFSICVFDLA